MYYVVNVDHQDISPEVTAKAFNRCYISNPVDGMVISCGMAGKRLGML
jgi:hypothetical protein